MKGDRIRLRKVTEREAVLRKNAEELALQAFELGTIIQACELSLMTPLEAAHAAIRCYRYRLGIYDGTSAAGFEGQVLKLAASESVGGPIAPKHRAYKEQRR